MTDDMVYSCLQLRSLAEITVHPANSERGGVNFSATEITAVNSLHELNLPATRENITLLEKQFPNLQIYIADYLPVTSVFEDDGDVTNR